MYAATPQTVVNIVVDVAGEHKEFNNKQFFCNFTQNSLVIF